MIRLQGVVEFRDGRLVEFKAGSAAIAEWERYARRHDIPATVEGVGLGQDAALVMACYELNGTLEGFEPWRASVFDVQMLEVSPAAIAVPPTLREASGE